MAPENQTGSAGVDWLSEISKPIGAVEQTPPIRRPTYPQQPSSQSYPQQPVAPSQQPQRKETPRPIYRPQAPQPSKKKSVWDRSQQYRALFLKNNPGLFGNWYLCAYCGKLISKKKMQVDHHIAVNLARTNPMYKVYIGTSNFLHNRINQFKCALTGQAYKPMRGINVEYNLIPACAECNIAKKDHGGKWVVRGFIGGLVWKSINSITNAFRWIFSKPIVRLVFLGLLAVAVGQYFIFGNGVFAFLGNIFGSIFSLLGSIWNSLMSIFTIG